MYQYTESVWTRSSLDRNALLFLFHFIIYGTTIAAFPSSNSWGHLLIRVPSFAWKRGPALHVQVPFLILAPLNRLVFFKDEDIL
jgi:hypothetical protein